jgi:hypothetical protein
MPWVLWAISEVQAFMPEGKAKGILHAVYLVLSDVQKALPAPAPAKTLPKDASSK